MASGRTLKFNEDQLEKIAPNFAKDDEKFENESNTTLIGSSHSNKLPSKLVTPKPIIKHIPENLLSTASTSKFSGFSMASGRTLKLNENHLKKIALDFAKEDEKFETFEVNEQNRKQIGSYANLPTSDVIISSTPIRVRDISRKRKFEDLTMMCSPVLKTAPRFIKTEIKESALVDKLKTVVPTESQEVESVLEMCIDLDDSIENIQHSPKKRRCTKTKLLTQFNQSTELNSSWNDVDMDLLKTVEMDNNISESVRKARRMAIETQLENIVHKESTMCCPIVGKMFEKKRGFKRMKINTYLEQQKPKELKRHQVTFVNALDYHFNMQNYLRYVINGSNY